jgi:recombination protein RecR
LLNFPQAELERFAKSLTDLKAGTKLCTVCKNVAESDICSVCADDFRNKHQILVVSGVLDAFAMEKTGYKGVYHVLHGVIDPLNNIGPEDIFIKSLIDRLVELGEAEIILATNTSMEGESTAMYLTRLIRESGFDATQVKVSRIARGLPVGGDIEYADDITLSRALEGRSTV